MKKKGIILTIVIILVVILFWTIGYLIVSNILQRNSLIQEFQELSELSNVEDYENLDTEKINEILNRTISKGKYAEVEKSGKAFLSDSLSNIENMAEILNDSDIAKSLTIDNYKEDGPEFKKTKEYLENTKKELQDGVNKYKECFTEEKIMSYINDKNLSKSYVDFYRNQIIGEPQSENDIKTVEDSINEVIDMLDKSEDIIDFLIENKSSWSISGQNIVFDTRDLLNQYNALLMQLV